MSNNGNIKREYDVIVIGGGPAGMMAAGRAASRGLSVLLVEKNAVLGKKLSITGGGRCNVTNAEFDTRVLLSHYGEAKEFLFSPFSQFSVQDTFTFFEEHKLPLIVQDRKRAFPKTEKALDVTKLMAQYVRSNGVTVLTNAPVRGFKTENKEIVGIITDTGTYTAKAYIIASGGKSHGETGSTGESISWLKAIGHTTHAPNPNLVPLVVEDAWIKRLAGTTLENVRITFTQKKKKVVKQGNILFTHFGLSGPLILNSAHEVKTLLKDGKVQGSMDLFPKDDIGTLRDRLNMLCTEHSNKTILNALREWFPKSVVEAILQSLPEKVYVTKCNSITREIRHQIVDQMKDLSCTVSGTMGYDWAIVSDGGVDLMEVDTKTMQSTLHKNLYFVGDVLHITRPSGGYSLQLCWTTGWVAGSSVCR